MYLAIFLQWSGSIFKWRAVCKILNETQCTQLLFSAVHPWESYNNPYIFPSFPSVCGHLSCSSRWAYGHDFWYVGVSYISVSKSTPLAVTGPHGQRASFIISCKPMSAGISDNQGWYSNIQYLRWCHLDAWIHSGTLCAVKLVSASMVQESEILWMNS